MAAMNETKRKIMDSMYHLIAEKGYDRASMNQLCRMVGVTKPSVYYYFDSKEAIFLEILDEMFPTLDLEVDSLASISDEDTYYQYLTNLGYTIIDGYHDDIERCIFLAELDMQSARIPLVRDHRNAQTKQLTDTFVSALQHGIDIHVFLSDFDIKHYGQMLNALTIGFSQMIAHHMEIDAKVVWKETIDLIFQKNTQSSQL